MAASAEQFSGTAQELLALIARHIKLDVDEKRGSNRKRGQRNEGRKVKAIAGPVKKREYKDTRTARLGETEREDEKEVTDITLKESA